MDGLSSFHYLIHPTPIQNDFFSYLYNTYYLSEISETIIFLLFLISIFIISLTKESQNIDIMPFVEKRKAKKLAKKLAKEQAEIFSPPIVPDGCWQCMGCGEILADTESRCKCGYKKP